MATGTRTLAWFGLAALGLLALAVFAARVAAPRKVPERGAAPAVAAEPELAPSIPADSRSPETSRPESGPVPGEDLADGLRVRVVHASDRRPAAGARVLYFDSGAVDWLAYEEFLEQVDEDLEPVVARFGREFRTDAGGLALVPFARAQGSIGAACDGEWAREEIDEKTEGEVLLELEPDLWLDVRLVDAGGAGVAHAMVTLGQRFPDRDYYVRGREWTDPEGRARFAHRRGLCELAREHALELFVSAQVLSAVPVLARIDAHAWPEDEVVLALGETGGVTVELARADGSPWTAPAEVGLAFSTDQLGRLRAAGVDSTAAFLSSTSHDGRVSFTRVGLGLELRASARPDGWLAHSSVFAGPTRSGESALARVVLAEPAPALAGRLVDREGRPFAGETLACEFWGEKEARQWVERRRTDAAGRFAGFGGPDLLDDGAWRTFFSIARDPRLGAMVELPVPMRAEALDLGDVVLDLPPLLASGIVVSNDGHPVRAARLDCEERMVLQQPHRTSFASRRLARGTLSTPTDGRFELRSWARDERLLLSVDRAGFVPWGPIEFLPPVEDWRIVLEREGAIAGRVVLSRGHPRTLVNLDATREDGNHRRTRGIEWSEDGSFRLGGLTTGTYRVTLHRWSNLPGAIQWPGVEVRAGSTSDLPLIDLDALLHDLAFEVLDEHGKAVPEVRFAIKRRGYDGLDGVLLESGPAGIHRLLALEVPVERLQIAAAGFRAVTLEDVSRGERIVLARGPRVRLVLSGGLPALREPWSLHARLVCGEEYLPAARFDGTGAAVLDVTGPGECYVGLALLHPAQPGFRDINGLSWHIDVREEAEQSFTSPEFTAEFLDNIEKQQGR